ncbi:ALDH-like protein [Aspergillus ibericus CBS 121593]|uniref:ALDH-like protein n=1 Tax=Aspergillus ibericus CBS 121593 TaxID=1448316 RepID=A0A395H6D3_9EURO|nr:ALDH-like protein [Aspergillus ibericus CBS 121593]RAL03109.1 ALDH-like protein [Aspergillus ibericus CBS 121593]
MCSSADLALAGLSHRHQARETFYRQTRALYESDSDPDKIINVVAVFLISFWCGGPNDQKDSWHWLGIAIGAARSLGLHRSTSKSHMSSQTAQLYRRIWWSLRIRDALVSGSIGRPQHFSVNDCVVEMLEPGDHAYKYGPLVDTAAFKKVSAMIARGKKDAQLLFGGNQIGDRGYRTDCFFYEPNPGAEIHREEVFGPVSVVRVFDTEDEVVAMANDTEYGLMAGVSTTDLNAMRMSGRIEARVCGVNCDSVMNVQVPFGGKKSSGIGRAFGSNVLDADTEPKTVLIYVGRSKVT